MEKALDFRPALRAIPTFSAFLVMVGQVSNYSALPVATINAKFRIRPRRYHQCSKPPNLKSTNATTNLTEPNLTEPNLT